MKNFTQKFTGLLAVLFSFTVNAQNCQSVADAYQVIINQVQATSDGYWTDLQICNSASYANEIYLDNCNYDKAEIQSELNAANQQIISLQSQLSSSFTQSDLDAAYASGASSVTPEDGITQSDVDAAKPLSLNVPLSLPEGWSMFGYSCIAPMDVIDGFSEVSENIDIVKDEMGLSYLPSWNFNALGNLSYGEGYQIKLINEIQNFQFCQTLISRIMGCIDVDACNLNEVANTDDGSCEYPAAGFGCDGNCISPNSDGICEGFEVYGCIDSLASNYNSLANTESNACAFIEADVPGYNQVVSMLECLGSEANFNNPWDDLCNDEAFQTIDWYDYYMYEGSSDIVESCIFDGPYGQQYCIQALENEYVELVSVLTGTCYASEACNYLEQEICDYTSCVGCQDPTAFNYDVEATVASECIPFIEGCIDPAACNFESEANTDDESCYNNNLGCGCDNAAALVGFNCEGTAIQIGDEIYGGMVFQINEDGTGLIVSLEVVEVMTWSNAQTAAAASRTEGYEDWDLPNIEQLELLYNTIGPGGNNSLGLVFQSGQYSYEWKFWSSSITPSNSNYVYLMSFIDGSISENYYPQNYTYSSRAIRAF